MRIYVTITLVCVITAAAATQDHLATLGISEGRAKEAVFDSFMADAVSIAGKPAAFTAMSPGARVALVNFALTLARTFVESDEFKRRYADHREANGPEPLPEEQTADAIFAKQRAGFENQVAEMRKLFDQITPEQRATLEEGWADMREAARRNGERRAPHADRRPDQGAARRAGPAARCGDERVRKSLSGGLARALVPCGCATSSTSRRTSISRPRWSKRTRTRSSPPTTLEAKPAEWKMCFRAGKPATDAARTFAQKWLSDLQSQGVK